MISAITENIPEQLWIFNYKTIPDSKRRNKRSTRYEYNKKINAQWHPPSPQTPQIIPHGLQQNINGSERDLEQN